MPCPQMYTFDYTWISPPKKSTPEGLFPLLAKFTVDFLCHPVSGLRGELMDPLWKVSKHIFSKNVSSGVGKLLSMYHLHSQINYSTSIVHGSINNAQTDLLFVCVCLEFTDYTWTEDFSYFVQPLAEDVEEIYCASSFWQNDDWRNLSIPLQVQSKQCFQHFRIWW